MNTETHTPTKIFIVEDDVFIGSILTEKILDAHIIVTRFINAEDALAALETEIPDMILLDIYLPGINGLVALQKIRENQKTKDILVVVLSNTDDKKDRDEATRLDAQFLIKGATEPARVLEFIFETYKKATA